MVVFGGVCWVPHPPTFCSSSSVLMEWLREGKKKCKNTTKNSKQTTHSTCTDHSATLLNDPGTHFTGFLELPPLGDPYISNRVI